MNWPSWASLAISLLAMVFAGVSASEAHKANQDRNNAILWSMNRNDQEKIITLRNLSTQRYRKVVVTLYEGNPDVLQASDGSGEYQRELIFKNVKPKDCIQLDFKKLGLPEFVLAETLPVDIIITATRFWGTLSQVQFQTKLINMYYA